MNQRQLGEQVVAAAEANDLEEMEKALAAGGSVNHKDHVEGYTALHHAASHGNVHMVKKLIEEHKADVMARSNTGRTPLHLAVRDGHHKVMVYLIEQAGTDPKAKTSANESLCHKACFLGDANFLRYVIEKGAAVDEADQLGSTPLMVAAEDGKVECMEVLLALENVSVNGQGPDNRTPLHVAATWGHDAAIDLLIKHKASVNGQDNHGNTPLHEACKKNKLGAVKHLMGAGADPSIKNNEGQTPGELDQKAAREALKK